MPNGHGGFPSGTPGARIAAMEDAHAEKVEAMQARIDWAERRIVQLAVLFGVPDGGQYLNDAIERAAILGLGTEEELREKVKDI